MSLDIYGDVEQRSDQWYDLRCGILTASIMDRLIVSKPAPAVDYPCDECGAVVGAPCVSKARKEPAPIKTAHSARACAAEDDGAQVLEVADNDTSRAVIATLVAERLTGFAEPTPTTSDMWRGIDLEPIARDAYSAHREHATEVGFMVRRESGWTLGYSPDGLIGSDGLIEIKAPRSKSQILAVLDDQVPAYNMAQIQAGLLVSGRKWLDFIPYVGGLPLWVKRVHPDPAWQAVIVAACQQFETTASRMVADYQTRTAGLPSTERYDPMSVELKL